MADKIYSSERCGPYPRDPPVASSPGKVSSRLRKRPFLDNLTHVFADCSKFFDRFTNYSQTCVQLYYPRYPQKVTCVDRWSLFKWTKLKMGPQNGNRCWQVVANSGSTLHWVPAIRSTYTKVDSLIDS